MDWQYNTYTIPLLISAAVSSAVALFAWRRRPAPAAAPLTAAMMTVVFWAMGYALELASIDLVTKIFWAKAQYLGIVSVSVSWLVFALAYYRAREASDSLHPVPTGYRTSCHAGDGLDQ